MSVTLYFTEWRTQLQPVDVAVSAVALDLVVATEGVGVHVDAVVVAAVDADAGRKTKKNGCLSPS